MKKQTEYSYRKRIKELESELARLRSYERFSRNIVNALKEALKETNHHVGNSYILSQITDCILR